LPSSSSSDGASNTCSSSLFLPTVKLQRARAEDDGLCPREPTKGERRLAISSGHAMTRLPIWTRYVRTVSMSPAAVMCIFLDLLQWRCTPYYQLVQRLIACISRRRLPQFNGRASRPRLPWWCQHCCIGCPPTTCLGSAATWRQRR